MPLHDYYALVNKVCNIEPIPSIDNIAPNTDAPTLFIAWTLAADAIKMITSPKNRAKKLIANCLDKVFIRI